jgi:serine/threonine protein kinase
VGMDTSTGTGSQEIIGLSQPVCVDRDGVLIGKGGFGKVYRIYHKLDNQYYAVKKILITESSIKNALHEIRVLASLQHPNITRYFYSWVEHHHQEECLDDEDNDRLEDDKLLLFENNYFFFNLQMEFCQMSLKEYLSRQTSISVQRNQKIIEQIVDGLDYLHQHGVVHRDIKPDNILVSSLETMVVKISDFGLAKVFRQGFRLTEQSLYVGTYLYASPEQFDGLACTFASDIYSLGIVIYEMQFLFHTEMERIQTLVNLKEKSIIDKSVPHVDMVQCMIHKNEAMRPTMPLLRLLLNSDLNKMNITTFCRDIVWGTVCRVLYQI